MTDSAAPFPAAAEAQPRGSFSWPGTMGPVRRIDIILHGASLALAGLQAESAPQPMPLLPWQQRKITQFIESNLHRAVPVQAMAETVRLSRSHFSRIFTQSLGCTPRVYLRQRRLERAKSLLRGSDVSLAEISLLCGFADQSHLCRHFRRQFGETPSRWRRRQQIRPVPAAA